ncbi:MAG: glycosyltransferase family 1 protein [Chloroflexi bacterium]|nr:glycosyltransferase family 1 protein [Chloroflexota bacterium]
MRIGLDLRLAAYREGGIPQYGRPLLRALADLAPDDQFVALQHRKGPKPLVKAANVTTSKLWTPPHHRWEQAALALELLPRRLDVLHSPDFIAPRRRNCPAVITVHDLAFLRFPDILTPDSARYYGQVQRAVENADGVIAVSESTRADMAAYLGSPLDRIKVIHHGIDPEFNPAEQPGDVAAFCRDHGLPQRFILWVGTLEPRKGISVLLEALSLAQRGLPEEFGTLVVAGPLGWLSEGLTARAEALGLGARVRFFGPATRAELVQLYQAAWVFAFPSLYEGFGLPPLEAMACGTPVIASDAPALPEVLGNAAMFTPALNPDALASALTSLAHDPALRARLRAAGLKRAAGFRWEHTARATMQVYREAVAG